jgi:hypothetical protein
MFAVTSCINSETKTNGYPGKDSYKKTQCCIIFSIILNSEIQKVKFKKKPSLTLNECSLRRC